MKDPKIIKPLIQIKKLKALEVIMRNSELMKHNWFPCVLFWDYDFNEDELEFIKKTTRDILDSNKSGIFRIRQPISIMDYTQKFNIILSKEENQVGLNFINNLEHPFIDYLFPDIFNKLGFKTSEGEGGLAMSFVTATISY